VPGVVALTEALVERCTHAPRHITWPDGEGSLTANGGWTGYVRGRPGEVLCLDTCPGCGLELWGLPGTKGLRQEVEHGLG
jgi:hypothetical protein